MYITRSLSSSSPQSRIQGNLEDKTAYFLKVTSQWWSLQDYEFSETHPSLLSLPFSDMKLILFAYSPWMLRSICTQLHTQHSEEEYYHQMGKRRVQDACTWLHFPLLDWKNHPFQQERQKHKCSETVLHIPRYTEKHPAGHSMNVTNTTRILFLVILVLLTNAFRLFYIYPAHH